METASADSMPEGVERQGIGTPATRAATIEKLVQKGFLERKGNKKTKVLLPTDKGKALITVMPEEIQSPEMTADWETKLLQIERGEMEPSEFMTEINTMITELVKNTEMKKGVNQDGKISAHYVDSIGFKELPGFLDKKPERTSVLQTLKEKCDAPECNPTVCRKARAEHEL